MKILQIGFLTACIFMLQACSTPEPSGAIKVSSGDTQKQSQTITAPPISVQLWSVRHAVKKDFKGSLKKIAEMGFEGVEFAGDYGPFKEDPKGLKAFLDSLGLKASGAHIQTKILNSEKQSDVLDFLRQIGVTLVIIPMDNRAFNADKIAGYTQLLSKLTAQLKAQGFVLAYHNHAQEFADYQSATYWDYLAKNTPKNMALQMDVGWVNFAGRDPITYIKRYPNRTLSTHIKIRSPKNNAEKVIIGQDDFDWAELITADVEHGGTQWLVIEQEEYPEGMTPMQSIEASRKGLLNFIKTL